MIIVITTIAAIAAVVFGVLQTKKLNQANEVINEKDTMVKVLRSHITNVESELKAGNDYIRSLRSELQSCTDKAKAAKAKVQAAKAPVAKTEKAAPIVKAVPAAKTAPKTKRPYKKKAD
jgi:peptidoglycan hydrolase CwlO-like protein